jgi:hypothetical protein
LAPRLGEAVEIVGAIYRIHESDDLRQMQRVVEHRIGTQCEEDRGRVGEPRGFDRNPVKSSDFPGIAALEKVAQGAREILAHRTAQASPRQFQHTSLDEIDEVMVDRDLAEFVDDDSRIGEGGRDERAPQQRRFATAEKPGQQGCQKGFQLEPPVTQSSRLIPNPGSAGNDDTADCTAIFDDTLGVSNGRAPKEAALALHAESLSHGTRLTIQARQEP